MLECKRSLPHLLAIGFRCGVQAVTRALVIVNGSLHDAMCSGVLSLNSSARPQALSTNAVLSRPSPNQVLQQEEVM